MATPRRPVRDSGAQAGDGYPPERSTERIVLHNKNMNAELLNGLNAHLTLEFRAAHEYLAMSVWLAENDLPGFAAWMRKQSTDELMHAQKVIDHLVERDQKVVIPPIPQPPAEWASAQTLIEHVYRSEQAVTQSINNLYAVAEQAKDRPATILLQWFVNEQVEEEGMARAVLGRLKLAGSTGIGLLMIDQELAAGKVPGMMTMMAPTSGTTNT
jgi:ferritin